MSKFGLFLIVAMVSVEVMFSTFALAEEARIAKTGKRASADIAKATVKDVDKWQVDAMGTNAVMKAYDRIGVLLIEKAGKFSAIEPAVREAQAAFRESDEIMALEKEIQEKQALLNRKLREIPEVKELLAQQKQHRIDIIHLKKVEKDVVTRLVQMGQKDFLRSRLKEKRKSL